MMPRKQNRLATILDDSLEAISNQGMTVDECLALNPAYQAELAPLLHLAGRLQAAHSLAPSAEFRTASVNHLRARLKPRSRLVSQNGHSNHAGANRPTRWLQLSPLLAALFLAIFLALSSGIWITSAEALPGDALYPMKAYAEKIQLAVTSSEARRANLRLDFADRRLRESEALQEQERNGLLSQAINDYAKQMDEESNLLVAGSPLSATDQIALANRLLTSVPMHQSKLSSLLEKAAPKDRASIQNAYQITQKVLLRAAFLAGRQPGDFHPPEPGATPTSPPAGNGPRPTLKPEITPRLTLRASPTSSPAVLPTESRLTPTVLPPDPTRTNPPRTPADCVPGTAPSDSALPTCWPTKPPQTAQPTPQPGADATATPRAIIIATLRATHTAHPPNTPWPWKRP
jgi:hypothetical protein